MKTTIGTWITLCVLACSFLLIESAETQSKINPAVKYLAEDESTCPAPKCECSCTCKQPPGPPPPKCCTNGGKGEFCCLNGANNPDCCENNGKGKYCCTNGADNPDCCANGGKGKFCCTNGANNPDCCANGGKGKFCCTNGANNVDCCENGGKGKYCCLNGANNPDCCDNGGRGKYCCTNGVDNPKCELPTTTTPKPTTPANTYLPAVTPIVVKKEEVKKFKGPTYLPPTKPSAAPRKFTTTKPGPRGTFTYGTYSIPKYTFSYTYPTYVPTRTRTTPRVRETYSYTTTEGYEKKFENEQVRNALKFA